LKKTKLAMSLFLIIVMVAASVMPAFSADCDEYADAGWLTIFNQSGATNAPLADSLFIIYSQTDEFAIQIIVATDENGKTDPLALPAGAYFIEQLDVQEGYALVSRLHFESIDGQRTEKSIFNYLAMPFVPRLTITNSPAEVTPSGQTPSGYEEAGNPIIIMHGHAEGWRFAGWSVNWVMRHGEFTSLFFTMPDTDVTVTAHWEEIEMQEPTPQEPENNRWAGF
jgi:hypothetical protein